MRKSVKNVVESMGFKLVDDKYQAKFIDDNTGSVVKMIADERPDNNGLPRLWFYGYDESDNILGKCTLDQMMTTFDEHYTPIPEKSNKKYACVYSLLVQVPVDMNKVDDKTYYDHICSDEEINIAADIAGERLKNLFIYNDVNVLEYSWQYSQEVK